LREERRLRVFENRVLRRVFGPKRGRGNKGSGENYIMRSLIDTDIDIDIFVNCSWVNTRWQWFVHIYTQTIHRII
jgi:hypothetical protein